MAAKAIKIGLAAIVVTAAAVLGWHGWRSDSAPELGSSADIGSAQAFAFGDCKARMFDGAPAIAVGFTQPLERQQNFAKLITASEGARADQATPLEARWVLGDNPRVLYLPYVTPDRQYHVSLSADLAAKSGAKLASAHTCQVKSEGMPDAFYFASRGVVLPAGQNGGLPVVTVNVPEVDVQFLRVKPESLATFLEQVSAVRRDASDQAQDDDDESDAGYDRYEDPGRRLKGRVGGYVLDELRAMSDSVYIGRFSTDARANRRNVNFLPIEHIKALKEPGIYVAVMNQPGRFGWDYQVTHFYVTDIGLHVRRHAAQLDVFSTSLKSGRALDGVELSLVDDSGKALGQTKTDASGHAVFRGRSDAARALLARRGQEMSVLALREPALDLSEFDATGHASRNNKVFLYAGRDLYRPGERFQVSVLSRDADGRSPATAVPITMTLKKPDGSSLIQQLVKPHASGSAYYQQEFELPSDAPTGSWLVQARIDPAAKLPDAQWRFNVEEFLPERMKLELRAAEGALRAASLDVQVQGDYLYGAPAAGNRLMASVYTERQINPLPQKLPGFVFGNFADDKAHRRDDLGDTALDAQGHASVAMSLNLAERSSPMRVRASFSLLESGGRPVVRTLERSWWPAEQLLAIRPLFDRNVAQEGSLAEFELTRVDRDGNFQAAQDLSIKLIYEERQWYWRYDDGRGWNSGFNTQEELVEARTLNLKARTKIALPVRWGRYRLEVLDPQTRQTLRYAFYAGWGAQDADELGNRPDRVQLKLQGAPYQPGQVAHLNIKPPHDGEALVTVEGDRVLYQKRLPVRAVGTEMEIVLDPAWQRHDLYITVAAFRPGSQGDRVTPARALGLVHLPLWREDRQLKVELGAPAKARPEQSLPVRIKAPQLAGKPALVTISAVDVGILNITGYKTPDPADFFFGKHRYGADMLDIYGKLIEKMAGAQAKQRFGGDAGKRETQSLPRKVLLVDLFSGPVLLDAKGEASVNLALPDFNGTLRVMAVVSSPDSYGSAQTDTVVAAPLVAELAMPRFIAPGDRATIALDLSNLSGSPQEVQVQLEASGPLRLTGKPAPVTLADKQRTVLRFQAEATDAWGLAPIRLTVKAGALKLSREAALQVQPATPLTREIKRVRLEPGASYKLDAKLLDSYWAGSAALNLTLSDQTPIDVRAQVRGLLMYPYGCLEQTTSSAYPLVFIDEDGARAFGMTPLSREERARRLDSAFARLAGMQQAKGGFGLWAAASPYEAWLSAYVTGFLQDARDAGFNVPDAMLKRSLESLTEQFQRAPGFQVQPPTAPRRDVNGRLSDYRELELMRLAHQRFAEATHAGYILAREQRAALATLRTLHDSYLGNARSPLPLLQLGVALKLMGDEARAKVAVDEAFKLSYGLQPQSLDGANHDWAEWLGDYGSRVRDLALGYALLHRHNLSHERREGLLFDLAADFDQRRYFSTQERLALFLAARSAQGQSANTGEGWTTTLSQAGVTEAWAGKGSLQQSIAGAKLKAGVTVRNDGASAVFLEINAQGYPIKPPALQDDRIKIERTLWGTDGSPVTRRQFNTGEMLIVRLRVSAKQVIKDGLVVDRIPAGFEVENLNLSQGPQAGEFTVEGVNIATANASERIVHTEYRDDRFVAAAKLGGQALDVFYLVRAVTPGRYVVPAAFAEDMYRPELRGIGKSEVDITVVDKRAAP